MSAAAQPDVRVERLVEAYRAIDGRMRGLPIHNARLDVEAIGFRRVDDMLVGALVTPWFLSVVVLGRPLPPEGESVELAFPGGRFTAMGASHGVAHLAIPLMSPVTELADREAARAVSEESLRLVLEGEPLKTLGRRGLFGLVGG